MPASRWPIVRNALALLVIAGSVAMAGLGKKKKAPEEPAPVPEVVAPPPPEAPPIWESPPPIAIEATPEGLPNISAQGCNGCHYQAHDDWQGSTHETAWQSPVFREAVARTAGSTLCLGCHLPLANQHPKLAAGYIDGDIARPDLRDNALWDPTLMSEGVTCAACHVRDGKVIGTRVVTDAPHPVAASKELGTSEMCAICHQLTWPGVDKPLYDTYGEWKASAYADAGVRCQDCHMPPRAGLAVGTRFAAQPSHGFSAETGRALSILVDLDTDEVQRGTAFPVRVKLQNTGAGHHVPTGSPFKRYRVTVELLGEDGRPLADSWSQDFGRTVADAPPWNTVEDTRIPAGGEADMAGEITVSQRKTAQHGVLTIAIHRVVGDSVSEPLVEHRVPVQIL